MFQVIFQGIDSVNEPLLFTQFEKDLFTDFVRSTRESHVFSRICLSVHWEKEGDGGFLSHDGTGKLSNDAIEEQPPPPISSTVLPMRPT